MKKLIKRWIKAIRNAAKECRVNSMWTDPNAPAFI